VPTTLASDGVSSTSCYTHLIVTTQPPTLKTVNSVSPFLNYFFVSKISTIKSSVAARLSGFHPSAKFPNSIVSGFSVDFIPSVTSDEVLKLLSSCSDKSSPMDFVPTSLLKSCSSTFSELITMLANLSFSQGQFPAAFKSASATPLVKNSGLGQVCTC